MKGASKFKAILAVAIWAGVTIPAGADTRYPWSGEWAMSAENCAEPNDGNIRYTENQLEGWEHSCGITRLQALSAPSSWLLDLQCSGEGEEWRVKELLMLDNTDTLHIFRGKEMAQFVRCAK
jgi:hypothetical protein